jgi:serine/threonine protein kinase
MVFLMSAEQLREPVIEVWPDWQGAVINGAYPLRRILHGSDHSAVFLTEYTAQDTCAAAIKIVPAEGVTLAQLAHWRTAAGLSHPHLVRLLDAGLYQLGGRQFLFVVMEYAEQTLAQVLPNRALTAEEVREMLLPTLNALAFLHGKNLVQGQLKPANFLVVNDQLKLASDTVRPAGDPRASLALSSLYDPPEAKNGGLSPAGDIWSLGVTIVETLTQSLPWPDEHSGTTGLPPTLPPAFVDPIQRCLSHDPARRPTATELEAEFKRAPDASLPDVPQAVVREAPPRVTAPPEPARRSLVPTLAAPACLMLLLALWAGLRMFHGHADSARPTSGPAQSPAQPEAGAPFVAAQNPGTLLPAPPQSPAASVNAKSKESKPPPARPDAPRPERPAPPLAEASPSVVHEQMPVVAHSALRTIHGHVKVAVLATVDPAGNVIETRLENPGPSAYFARSAREAAGKWKFASADGQDSRHWLLRFEFTSSGTTGHATPR